MLNTASNGQNQSKQMKVMKHQLATFSEFIVRMSKVYEGAFPSIDEHLHVLRNQLKKNSSVSEIEETLSSLTGPILENADAIKHYNLQTFNLLESFANQMLNLDSSSVQLKQDTSEFISQLHSSNFTLFSSLEVLTRCFDIFKQLLDESGNPVPSDSSQENAINQDLHDQITNEFRDLIELLIAAEPGDKALLSISKQLTAGISHPELLECCLTILKTLLGDVFKERKQAEKYVNSIHKSLLGFNSKLEESVSQSEKHYQLKLENTEALKVHLEDMETVVTNSQDLTLLKQQASDVLSKMSATLADRENGERDEQLMLMDLLSQMKSQLASLEKQTNAYRQRLVEQKYHSHRDPLTQVPNRNAYNERVELEFRRWKRHKHPISLAVVDVDYFKQINDRFGHAAGDKTLQVIAQNISRCLRTTDFFARWGGEEFVVLLPQTTAEQVKKPLETIRKQIQQIPFKFKDEQVIITASIGATEFVEGDSIQTTFERADRALYEAKNSGRNRCIVIKG